MFPNTTRLRTHTRFHTHTLSHTFTFTHTHTHPSTSLVVSLAAHGVVRPYRSRRVNVLEALHLACGIVVLVAGIAFLTADTPVEGTEGEGRLSDTARALLGTGVILIIVGNCAAIALVVIWEIRHQYSLVRSGVTSGLASDDVWVGDAFFSPFGMRIIAQVCHHAVPMRARALVCSGFPMVAGNLIASLLSIHSSQNRTVDATGCAIRLHLTSERLLLAAAAVEGEFGDAVPNAGLRLQAFGSERELMIDLVVPDDGVYTVVLHCVDLVRHRDVRGKLAFDPDDARFVKLMEYTVVVEGVAEARSAAGDDQGGLGKGPRLAGMADGSIWDAADVGGKRALLMSPFVRTVPCGTETLFAAEVPGLQEALLVHDSGAERYPLVPSGKHGGGYESLLTLETPGEWTMWVRTEGGGPDLVPAVHYTAVLPAVLGLDDRAGDSASGHRRPSKSEAVVEVTNPVFGFGDDDGYGDDHGSYGEIRMESFGPV